MKLGSQGNSRLTFLREANRKWHEEIYHGLLDRRVLGRLESIPQIPDLRPKPSGQDFVNLDSRTDAWFHRFPRRCYYPGADGFGADVAVRPMVRRTL